MFILLFYVDSFIYELYETFIRDFIGDFRFVISVRESKEFI